MIVRSFEEWEDIEINYHNQQIATILNSWDVERQRYIKRNNDLELLNKYYRLRFKKLCEELKAERRKPYTRRNKVSINIDTEV